MQTFSSLFEHASCADIIIAIMLCVITVSSATIVLKSILGKAIKQMLSKTDSKEKSSNKKKGYAYCKLNELMGYDFVQIQTPCIITKESKIKNPENVINRQDFEQNNPDKIIQRMGVTGAHNYTMDDEPNKTDKEIEETKRHKEEKQIEKEIEKAAEENDGQVLSNDANVVLNIVDSGNGWPENMQQECKNDWILNFQNETNEIDASNIEDVEENGESDYSELAQIEVEEQDKQDKLLEMTYEKIDKLKEELNDMSKTSIPEEKIEELIKGLSETES